MMGSLASASCLRSLVGTTFILLQQYSCYSNSRCICSRNKLLKIIRSGSFSTSSCSRYSLSSEYTRSCASFHCTSRPLILGRISLAFWWSAPDNLTRIFFSPPNRIRENSYCSSGVTNTVLYTSSGVTGIYQYPLVKSILDRYFLPLGRRNRSSAITVGSGSTSVIFFQLFQQSQHIPC